MGIDQAIASMDLKLNFIGVTVCDFDTSFRFYTETLGMTARDSRPSWALFDTTGTIFELFGGGKHKGGDSQTVLPCLHVAGLEKVVERLKGHGVHLDGESEGGQVPGGVRFVAPEGLRWCLSDDPAYYSGESMGKPNIATIYLSTGQDKLEALHRFYVQLMGLTLIAGDTYSRRFRNETGEPELIIQVDPDGGKQRPVISNRREAPHYLSFQTVDIEPAAAWIRSQGPRILQDVTHHEWGGIDLQILAPTTIRFR